MIMIPRAAIFHGEGGIISHIIEHGMMRAHWRLSADARAVSRVLEIISARRAGAAFSLAAQRAWGMMKELLDIEACAPRRARRRQKARKHDEAEARLILDAKSREAAAARSSARLARRCPHALMIAAMRQQGVANDARVGTRQDARCRDADAARVARP